MRHIRSFAAIVVLAAVSASACAFPQSAPASRPGLTSPAELDRRYRALWDSVAPGVPDLVAHLGVSRGSAITVWARAEHSRNGPAPEWSIQCAGDTALPVELEVFDPTFGVSKLTIRRTYGSMPSRCTLSDGTSTADIVLPAPARGATGEERFSFLAFSCSEPFSTGHRGILARDLSLWLRMERRAMGEDSRGQLPTQPDFVLGLGDQVYVDPDPDAKEPLAFFRGRRADTWLIQNDAAALRDAFNVVYRYNFSLPPIAGALSRLPSVMMWDDHEIRDGWGSQGDEDSVAMQRLFAAARHAFVANQLLRSFPPDSLSTAQYEALVRGERIHHPQFSHGSRTHVLMLDSRSTRSTTIFDSSARAAVAEWLARGRQGTGDLFVLGVGVPLFPTRAFEAWPTRKILDKADGLADDLIDGWGSERNRGARDSLLAILAAHFRAPANRDDRLLVLSGDVHYSALYYLALGDTVIGHELVTSGIAHALPAPGIIGTYYNDIAAPVGGFAVTPAGKITQSASFAELVVDASDALRTPSVDVVLHTNGGFDRDDYWRLANTHLLSPQEQPLWYYPYRYRYQNLDDHLHNVRTGRTPAGTIVELAMAVPEFRTRRPIRFWRTPNVLSALLPHSVFCTVPESSYNVTRARSWNLAEYRDSCVPHY